MSTLQRFFLLVMGIAVVVMIIGVYSLLDLASGLPASRPVDLPTPVPPTLSISTECLDFAQWSRDSLPILESALVLNDRGQTLLGEFLSVDVSEFVDLSEEYAALAEKQGGVRTTPYTQEINDSQVRIYEVISSAFLNVALGLTINDVEPVNLAAKQITEAASLQETVSTRLERMTSMCSEQNG